MNDYAYTDWHVHMVTAKLAYEAMWWEKRLLGGRHIIPEYLGQQGVTPNGILILTIILN